MPQGSLSKHVMSELKRQPSGICLVLSLPAMDVNGSPNPPKHPRELGHNILSYFPMNQCKSCKSNSPPFPTLPMALTIYDLNKGFVEGKWHRLVNCATYMSGILENPYLQFGSYIFKKCSIFPALTGGDSVGFLLRPMTPGTSVLGTVPAVGFTRPACEALS